MLQSEFVWTPPADKHSVGHLKLEITGQFNAEVLINYRQQLDFLIKWLQERDERAAQ